MMGRITVEKNVKGIPGLCVITPAIYGDSRGYFMEIYNKKDMADAGINFTFVQGLHFQKRYPQTKLVRVVSGTVFDVAVDLRAGSDTYGKYHGEILSAENRKQLLIPRGFAHGFLVLSETAEFCYKCDAFYHPGDEGGISWNDPDIGIIWPELEGRYNGTADAEGYTVGGSSLILSEKDLLWPGIKDTEPFRLENG